MGLFKNIKAGMDSAANAQQFALANATQAPTAGQLGVAGMPVDPASMGGPSTQPLAADDPMLAPVDGIGLAEYAAVSKQAQARGVTSEAGMGEIAAEMGYDPAVFLAATQEWMRRMGQSMVVGQQFRAHMGY